MNEGQAEILLGAEEREILKRIDKELGSISPELIGDIIWKNISNTNCNTNYHIYSNIGPSLGTYLSPDATNILLFFISMPHAIKIFTGKLKDEGIFTDKTNHLLLDLSAKYGSNLASIREGILRPKDWIRIESEVLIAQEVIKLHSILWKFDGTSLEFDAPIESTILLADHFLKSTLDAIRIINKESVLEIDKKQIELLENRIKELKDLRASVESKIEPKE